ACSKPRIKRLPKLEIKFRNHVNEETYSSLPNRRDKILCRLVLPCVLQKKGHGSVEANSIFMQFLERLERAIICPARPKVLPPLEERLSNFIRSHYGRLAILSKDFRNALAC